MPQIVTFLPNNSPPLIVEVDTGLAVNELDATEIYSEWKDWLLADPQRQGYPKAFAPIGGDEISASLDFGVARFLENGWRIRPAEYGHKLTVIGNLFTRESGKSIFVPTIGTFNVHTETQVSALIFQTKTGAIGLPGLGVPPTSLTPDEMIAYLYKAWRNRKTQTETDWSLYDDAGTTVDQQATVSDDGTTFEKSEVGSG